VTTRVRRLDRARYRAIQALVRLGAELREGRIGANLTLRQLGAVVGLSSSEISRIELGQAPNVPYVHLVTIASALGMDLPLRAFPAGDAVRDAPQLALLGRFRARLPGLRHVAEVGLARPGDLRAWDEVAFGDGWSIPIEAESVLRDIQALERRQSLKLRDSGHDRMILLVAGTRNNRHVLRLARDSLAGTVPVSGEEAMADLERGRCPRGSAIVLL
jgi:transcriptional regulator with XRE-family HTH domain